MFFMRPCTYHMHIILIFNPLAVLALGSCVEECLGEAERVLRGSSGGEEMLVLADVHLWIYIVQHERFCKQVRYLPS